jgi:flagellin
VLTVDNLDLDLGSATGVFANIGATANVGTSALAKTMVKTIETAQGALSAKLGDLGAASRKIERQSIYSTKLSDVIEGGIGKLVDADLAKESARLQALQVKQQLGIQALSIANQAPQAITGLFR